MDDWLPISSAPRDGTVIRAVDMSDPQRPMRTRWGKASHVPFYGWSYCVNGYVEDCELWDPTHWQPVSDSIPQEDAAASE